MFGLGLLEILILVLILARLHRAGRVAPRGL
jgi:hypothetical protein